MKIFASILSLYLLFLIAIPCCAFDTCPDEGAQKEQSESDAKNNTGDCGTCSPFFQCERCTVITMPTEQLCMEIVTTPVSSLYADYTVSAIPETHFEHWRPPQL